MMLNRTISCPVFGRPWKLYENWSLDFQQIIKIVATSCQISRLKCTN